jgi:uncharacterized membrane protein YagU involved in acid resistance
VTSRRDGAWLGALAGFVATMPMTAVMSRLHRWLPAPERYPLPPRELTEDLPWPGSERSTGTLVFHFLYGAAAGGLLGATSRRPGLMAGAGYGVLVWMGSYLGWIPASRRLVPATRHPARRNRLMLAAHLVWGAALALGLEELERSRLRSFSLSTSANPHLRDRPEASR